MTVALSVRNLRKAYNGTLAVDDISFDVMRGEKFIFVGPNGAGKSTTIKIISTLLEKNAGTVKYGDLTVGVDDDAIRKKIGVVFQHHVLDDEFTVRENLVCRGGFYDMNASEVRKRADEVIELLDMHNFANQRYGKLSGGQRRRADIGRALMQRPEILFLDEPTTGLDPQTRLVVWDIINGIQQDLGMTIFLTTHYMEEAEALCTRICVMDEGRIIASGTQQELVELVKERTQINIKLDNINEDLLNGFKSINGVFDAKIFEDMITLYGENGDTMLAEIISKVSEQKSKIQSIDVQKPNLEAVFLHLTGKALRD